jgi:hypothetical protein
MPERENGRNAHEIPEKVKSVSEVRIVSTQFLQ